MLPKSHHHDSLITVGRLRKTIFKGFVAPQSSYSLQPIPTSPRPHSPIRIMYTSTVFSILAAVSLATARPNVARAPLPFPNGIGWDIILQSKSLTLQQLKNAPGPVIDIDLWDNYDPVTKRNNISELAKTKRVICYFSAGSRENWRPDAGEFNPEDYGKESK